MVAVDLKPRRWASRCTVSQASGPPFLGSMRVRTRVGEHLGAAAGDGALAGLPQAVEDVARR